MPLAELWYSQRLNVGELLPEDAHFADQRATLRALIRAGGLWIDPVYLSLQFCYFIQKLLVECREEKVTNCMKNTMFYRPSIEVVTVAFLS